MSSEKNKKQKIDLWALLQKVSFGISQPLIEIIYGIRKDTITYWPLISWGLLFDFLVLSNTDRKLFNLLKISWLYPTNPISYTIYCIGGVTLGFWIWGGIETRKRVNLIHRLTNVFTESGLKSPMGRLPHFIFDKPVDELVRKMRVTNAFMPKAKFEEAKDRLESSLQIYIDEISDNRASGTVDLLYSHFEIKKTVELKDISSIGQHSFSIGQTRAKPIVGSFLETPHLLIGGQTGGGKSTFLRQLITTLYCSNKGYSFSLIDMKGGLEFQLFEGRERFKVLTNAADACTQFEKLDSMLTDRMSLLKANNCKDIDDFQNKPNEQKVYPQNIAIENHSMNRHIVVIDEAAELFLAGSKVTVASVQDMTRKAIRLAAQGRAVGIHLIVATQKPDSKAVSSQIKANLTGIISFPMATLGASYSILGNGRAKELPSTPGRAIWKSGLYQYEVQTPFLGADEAKLMMDKLKTKNGTVNEEEPLEVK